MAKEKVTVKSKEDLDPKRQNFNRVMEQLKSTKSELLFLNAAIVLLGLVMVCIPQQFNQFIGQILGIVLCCWGVLRVISFLRLKNEEIFGSYALVQGAAMIGFGLFFLLQADRFAQLLNSVLTLIILVAAVLKLQNAINYYKLRIKNWWLHLLAAVVLLVFGIIALVKPGFVDDKDGLVVIMTVIMGIALIISGVWDMFSVLILSKTIRQKAKEWDEQGLLSSDGKPGKTKKEAKPRKAKTVINVKEVETTTYSDAEVEEIDGLDYGDDFEVKDKKK